MTAAVHDVRRVSSMFMENTFESLRNDVVNMVQLLTTESSDKRENGLEHLKSLLRSNNDEHLTFPDLLQSTPSIFKGLVAALDDHSAKVRLKTVVVIGDLVSRIDSDVVDTLGEQLLAPLVLCFRDDEIAVREATVQTLRTCIESVVDCTPILNALVQHGINSRDVNLWKSVIENLPLLFSDCESMRSANFEPLVLSLVRSASPPRNENLVMQCLSDIQQLVGKDEFDLFISHLPKALLNKYNRLLKQYEIGSKLQSSPDLNVNSTPSNSKKRSSLSSDTSRQSELVFGVIPSSIIDRLCDLHSDQRTMSNAMEELCHAISTISDVSRTFGAHLLDFIKLLGSFLDDGSSFQIVTGSLHVLGLVIEHSQPRIVLKNIDLLVTILTKRMNDKNVMVRKSVMHCAMSLMHSVSPAETVDAFLADNMSHRHQWRVRQFTVDIVIAALLKYPSNAFDLSSVCVVITRALLDPKRAVRLAAMECVAVVAQAMGVGRQQALIVAVDQLEVETESEGVVAAVHARLSRRQLPVVGVDGLIEYVSNENDWISRGSSTASSAHSNCMDANEGCVSTPPSGRRHLSASKSLSKMPWEKEGVGSGDRRKILKHHNSALGVFQDSSASISGHHSTAALATIGWQSARSLLASSPTAPLSSTWPNPQMFEDRSGMVGGGASSHQRHAHFVQQLQPLMLSTSPSSGSESDRGPPVASGKCDSSDKRARPPLARGTSRPTLGGKKPGPILLPELARNGDGEIGTLDGVQEYISSRNASDNLDEINDSLRQIRNSASKKQLNKIFERTQSESAAKPSSSRNDYETSRDFSDKTRKESFFDTKPRLVRRNTLLLREGFDSIPTSSANLDEIQNVTVVGRGYADELPTGGTNLQTGAVKVVRDKRRVVKGSILSPLSSTNMLPQWNDEGDRLPPEVVGKAALSTVHHSSGDNGSSFVGRGDEKSSGKGKAVYENEEQRHAITPPSGIVGRGVQYDQSSPESYSDDVELSSGHAMKRASEIERMNRSHVLRRRQLPDKYQGAGEYEESLNCDETVDGYPGDQASEDRPGKPRKRRVRRPLEPVTVAQPAPLLAEEESDCPEDWKPFKDPVVKLNEAIRLLGDSDWERKCDGLKTMRHLACHHSNILSTQLHSITLSVIQEVKNLRSQVSRQAMVCLGEMFSCLKKSMDNELDHVTPVLLIKVGETNKFMREDAEKALVAMVENTTPIRAFSSLTAFGATHLSVAVRNETAHLVLTIVELMGSERVLKDIPDKILTVAAKFLQDGSLETRYYGQLIFCVLFSNEDFDRQLAKHTPSSTLRNIQDKLDTLRRRGPPDPPSGMTRLQKTVSQSKGVRGNSAPSSETGSLLSPPLPTTSLSASGPKRRVVRDGEDDTLGVLQGLESNDPQKRLESISELHQLVDSNYAMVAANITKVFSKFVPCMKDNNSRVKLLALQTMEQMLPSLSDCLSNLIPVLVEAAAGNLTSSAQIAKAACAVLDSFMEHFEPAMLLQPFIKEAQKNKPVITIDMVERVSCLIPNIRQTRMLTINVLPFTWYLLREVLNSACASARSSRLRRPVGDFLAVLYAVLGPDLLSASAVSSEVTPAMQILLTDLIEETS